MTQTAPSPEATATPKRRINLGFDKYSGLYVWALLVIIFSLWIPDLFLNLDNFKTILSFQAISTIVALGLIIPVAAGAFDLTIAATLTVSAVFTAWALLNHTGVVFAAVGALLIGVVIGLANAIVVVKLKVDSFIGTLGMSSILAAVAYMISGGGQLVLPEAGYYPFLDFARQQWFGISASVYYARRPGHRDLVGPGVHPGRPLPLRRRRQPRGSAPRGRQGRTDRHDVAFITSAVVCSFAGIVYLSQNANGAPDSGANYLLPAFSAVFLGATQIRPGRVNVLGTIIAILLLATGVTGLQLAGAPTYVTQLFNGVALIVAMALAARTARRRG